MEENDRESKHGTISEVFLILTLTKGPCVMNLFDKSDFNGVKHRKPVQSQPEDVRVTCPNVTEECLTHCYHSLEHQRVDMCTLGVCVITFKYCICSQVKRLA
jgi:hypothetical protein